MSDICDAIVGHKTPMQGENPRPDYLDRDRTFLSVISL